MRDLRPVYHPLSYLIAAGACLLAAMGIVPVLPVAATGGSALFVDAWAFLGLAPLLLAARNLRRAYYGSAVAWGYLSLPCFILTAILSLHFIHLSRLIGLVSCDAMANDCGFPPLPFWLPLVLLLVGSTLLVLAVRASKALEMVAPIRSE